MQKPTAIDIEKLSTDSGLDIDKVLVSGGTFTMGDTWGDGFSHEKPTHRVTVSSFYMSKYEITQKEWREVFQYNPSNFTGNDNRPVEQITWSDAVWFCNDLSKREGLTPVYTINGKNVSLDMSANGYRLPTEAEWEYAARGGNKSRGYKYSGSDTPDAVAWYDGNSGNKTHPVGQKQANELGIYDMSGNVSEWCWDWYGSYSSYAQTNPTGPSSGSYHVYRGGNWNGLGRIAGRGYGGTAVADNDIGFRVVRSF